MNILIAADGSEFSKEAIKKCSKLISTENSSVRVISAVEPMTPMGAEPFAVSADYMRDAQAELLNKAKGFAEEAEKMILEKFQNAKIETSRQVVIGDPARAIVEEAESWKADLIVVGSHGYGFWRRMVAGSVSQAVMNHAPCSVLVVRKAQDERVLDDRG